MAIKKTIELDVNTKAGLKAMDELGLSFEEAFTEADNLSGQIGELEDALYAMAAAGQQNTQEYKDLGAQIGVYKKVIIDTDMSVDALSQTTAQKMGGALGGVTAGFELGAGAMGAFGMEGEAVEEALLRVQSAMAISQGIDGIRQAIPAFKAMKMAIMSNVVVQKLLNFVMSLNPIGMIIAAVVGLGVAVAALFYPVKALLSYFGLLGEEQESAAESSARLTSELEKQDKAMEKANANREREHAQKMRRLDIEEASERDRLAAVLSNLDKEQEGRKEDLENTKQALKDLRVEKDKAREEGEWELAQEIQDQLEAKRESYNELVILVQDHKQNVLDTTQEGNKKIEAEESSSQSERVSRYREFLAKKKELEDTALAVAREIEAGRIELMEDGFEKETETIRNKFKIQREDLLANEKLTQSQKAELQLLHDVQEEEALNVLHQKKLTDARARAQELIDAEGVKAFGDLADPTAGIDAEVEAEEIKMTRLDILRGEYRRKDEESEAEHLARIEELNNGHLGKITKGLDFISGLSNSIMESELLLAGDNEEKQEKIRKRGFERAKKIAIATAIVTGIQSTMAAFLAGLKAPVGGLVLAPIMAAQAAIASATNIQKIRASTYEGGGSSTPATGRMDVQAPVVPSFNIAGNSTENQLAQSLGQQEQAPIKAMVVSTEVTTAQSLDRNKIDTATL